MKNTDQPDFFYQSIYEGRKEGICLRLRWPDEKETRWW